MNDWDDLADELWLKFMEYLPSKDLISLMCCSKRYYNIGKDVSLWKIVGYGHHLFSYQLGLIHWMGKQEKNFMERKFRFGRMINAIVAGTGVGKTIINIINSLLSPVKGKTLIVLPPSLISTWEEEISIFWNGNPPFKYYVFHNIIKNQVKKVLNGETYDFDQANFVIVSNMLLNSNNREEVFDILSI
jgi:SNF2 family DNA or RNA helicase